MLHVLPGLSQLRRLPAGLILLVVLLLFLSLSGCSGLLGTPQPPQGVLLDALSRQIQLTQADIARALGLEAGGMPQVSRVRVTHQEALRIGTARGVRLSGQFDWRLPGDPFHVDSPFTIVLQQGERGESWRLARPGGGGGESPDDWLTYPLPLPGEGRG